jgi:glutamate dehydrogenase/leucine dehydrogenase
VNEELRGVMQRAWRELAAQAKRDRCSFRGAAFALALSRVASATDLRGV